jgi:hypothetical protein
LKCFEIGSLILGCFGRFGFDGVVNDLEKEKKLNFFFSGILRYILGVYGHLEV